MLSSCGGDKSIRVWSKLEDNTWGLKALINDAQGRTIRKTAWNPKVPNAFASASFDSTTLCWQPESDVPGASHNFVATAALEGHQNEVKAVSWSSDGNMLATCSRDKCIWLWEGTAPIELQHLKFCRQCNR